MISRYYDVAEIFEYAMMNGTADYFKNEGLQKKLDTLSETIREAFDLKENKERLPWEKYLSVAQ